jgi:hypothetical protein
LHGLLVLIFVRSRKRRPVSPFCSTGLRESLELTGKTTRGFDRDGQSVDLPVAKIEVAEWKAKQAGWI